MIALDVMIHFNGLTQPFHNFQCFLHPGVRKEEGEFLTAPTGEEIPTANGLIDQIDGLQDDLVADEVTIIVIDGFEIIKIEKHQGERNLVVICARNPGLQGFIETSPVRDASQRIRKGEPEQFPIVLEMLALFDPAAV